MASLEGVSATDTFVKESVSEVEEATRFSAPRTPAAQSWSLTPKFGMAFTLAGTTLIGRDPDASQVEGSAKWSIDDPERTVSKTHAVVGIEGDEAWIEDWNSTNGVLVRRGTSEIEVVTGARTTLADGDVILLGDLEVDVRWGA